MQTTSFNMLFTKLIQNRYIAAKLKRHTPMLWIYPYCGTLGVHRHSNRIHKYDCKYDRNRYKTTSYQFVDIRHVPWMPDLQVSFLVHQLLPELPKRFKNTPKPQWAGPDFLKSLTPEHHLDKSILLLLNAPRLKSRRSLAVSGRDE